MIDRSNGYEGIAAEFLSRRGNAAARSRGIGVKNVREWARTLPRGCAVIDLGCGPGFPITDVLVTDIKLSERSMGGSRPNSHL